jgi:hypothetical protein
MELIKFRWCWLLAAGMGVLPPLSSAAEVRPRSLYDGDTVMFERAQLIKPQQTALFSRANTLAPLIIQEVLTEAAPHSAGSSPGFLPRYVHFQPSAAVINGRPHEQMTYWWSHDPIQASGSHARRDQPRSPPLFRGGAQLLLHANVPSPLRPAGLIDQGEHASPVQAVRLTMDAGGAPVIYEWFGGSGSIEQIFVTQSIEAAAHAEFGPPLPGRRHAVEASLDVAPHVVVPRVLDDPPDIMGPILYLRAAAHTLATLICRCMDAQARELVGQGLYELVPAAPSRNTSDATRLEAAFPRWLREDFSNQTNRLSRSLRLPADF